MPPCRMISPPQAKIPWSQPNGHESVASAHSTASVAEIQKNTRELITSRRICMESIVKSSRDRKNHKEPLEGRTVFAQLTIRASTHTRDRRCVGRIPNRVLHRCNDCRGTVPTRL